MARHGIPAKSRARVSADPGDALPLPRIPLALARHFFQICTAASAGTVAAEGLKSGQFSILAHLRREPGLDQNAIAVRMGVDRARVSQLVDELEVMGLIDRRVNGTDRRARVLRLTPRGEELQTRLQPVVKEDQMRVLAPLARDERELLLDLLVRVIRANRALPHSGTSSKRAVPGSRPRDRHVFSNSSRG